MVGHLDNVLNANLWKAKSNRIWFQTIPGQPCTIVMQSLILLVILILASAESGCEDLLIGSWAGPGFICRQEHK